MKRFAFVCAVGLATCGPARSQLVLNPGDTFAYSFSSLPLTGFVSSFNSVPSGVFGFTVRSNSFQAGDLLRYEMFENSVAESPIFSGTLSTAPPFSLSATNAGAWQDVQGAVRFTMLSGSVTLDSVSVKAIVPGPSPSSYNVYRSEERRVGKECRSRWS